MSDFKEFQGKTLDAAIAEACAYYDAPREKLEIDIIEDAKTGIFGLVGARKARVRARRALLPEINAPKPRKNDRGRKQDGAEPAAPVADETVAVTDGNQLAPEKQAVGATVASALSDDSDGVDDSDDRERIAPQDVRQDIRQGALQAIPQDAPQESPQDSRVPAKQGRRRTPRGAGEADARQTPGEAKAPAEDDRRQPRPGRRRREDGERPDNDADAQESALPRVNLSELDQTRLLTVTTDMIRGLVLPVLGEEEPELEIRISDDRVQVQIHCDDTGLLIGRDGQNLAAVQYLAARMITRAMGSQIRVQVDAGDYHSRQDVRLQELALSLAEKMRATGKPQASRPLSAYQRRVIHLALQDSPDVQTRSSGEGPLKRVVVQRKKD